MAKKLCRLDVEKAIIDNAFEKVLANRKTYARVEGSFNTFYIANSSRVVNNRANGKRNVALTIAKNKITEINKKYKDKIRATIIDTDPYSPVQFRLYAHPAYIEHEFAKLKEERQNDIPVNLEKNIIIFSKDYNASNAALMEQEALEDADRSIGKDEPFTYAQDLTDEEGTPFLSKQKENEVNASIKALGILQSDKAKTLFRTLENKGVTGEAFWNKIQNDLQIPKAQIDLMKQLDTTDIDDITAGLLANYSFTIEINTTKDEKVQEFRERNKDFTYNNVTYLEGDGEYGKRVNGKFEEISFQEYKKAKQNYEKSLEGKPTQYYSNLTVPGGTNYTENEIATPAIIPAIKGHARFATDKGIGWFRSDEQITFDSGISEQEEAYYNPDTDEMVINDKGRTILGGKTRRILEVQSDLFQKGRDKENLITHIVEQTFKTKFRSPSRINIGQKFKIKDFWFEVSGLSKRNPNRTKVVYKQITPGGQDTVVPNDTILLVKNLKTDKVSEVSLGKIKEYFGEEIKKLSKSNENQFLQLLNKDNNWVTFFVKSIIQDSAKKGYEKVVFPTGSTAYKIESGGNTIEDFIKNKEDILDKLNKKQEKLDIDFDNGVFGLDASEYNLKSEKIQSEIEVVEKEIEDAKAGVSGLAATAKFYETTIANILKKQGYVPVQVKDEYGNTWNEITLDTKRDLDTIYYQLETNESEKEQASKQLDSTVMRFLEKIGVSVQSVDRIRDINGNPIDAVAKASMLNKIIEVIDGKSAIDTLPEEASHFFVEMLGEGHPLYKEMYSKIENYEVYNETLEQYKRNPSYRDANGDINYDKIKKEAMGKLIAKHIVQMDPGAETDTNLERAIMWWQKLWEYIKSIFSQADENPFEEAANRILMGDTSDLYDENVTEDDEYYQLLDPLQGLLNDQSKITLDNSIDPRTGQKRHIYDYEGEKAKGSVTSVYVDRWLKKIFRTDSRSDIQKMVDLLKAEFGDVVHEQIQDIIKSWTNPDGTKRDTQNFIKPKMDPVNYKILNNYIQKIMEQYEPETKFFAEVKIFDKKTKIAGSIDLLVVEPDGTVEIYDWKTQEIFKDQTDIKTYKEPMYRIQLDNYRKILEAQYGFKKFGRIRAFPIATQFNWQGGKPISVKSLEVGSLDLEMIPENKSYLLPVGLRTESTGDSQIDRLLKKLYGIYDKIEVDKKRYSKEEVYKKREELEQFRTALRDLQLRNRVEKLVDLGLVEYKKYLDKMNSKTLRGREIPEALSVLEVFSKSGTMLYELRQELRETLDPKDEKAVKAFEDLDKKFLLMTSKASKLIDDIQEYRKIETEKLAERNGIFNYLDPEQTAGRWRRNFTSLSNITQKGFRVFSSLLRRAQNIRDIKFDEAADKLTKLKKEFVNWTKSKGLSSDRAMDMILDIDEKGNWNGNFLNPYKPEFRKERLDAIESNNSKWLLSNLIYDNERYEKAEKKQIEFFNSIVYSADELKNRTLIQKKINEWIGEHRVVNPNGSINYRALYNKNNRFLKPDEKWFTDKWKDLNKPENKPLKDMYDYFQGLVRYGEKLGMLDKYSPHFIPSIAADKMDQLVFGDIKGLFSAKGMFENLEVDSGTQYTPEVDPVTGEVINRIPVYFTKDMGVENPDGTIDYSKKSRDLFRVFGTWAAHMYNYEAMDSIQDDALMLTEVERSKGSLVTDAFNNIVMEGGQKKQTEENKKNADLLEDFVYYYLYDKTSGRFKDKTISNPFSKDPNKKQYSLFKGVRAAIQFFSLKTLGLNIGSGTANFVGGTGNAMFQAQKGILFTMKTWAKAIYLTTGDKKTQAALEYMNILQEGNKYNLINHLSLSATNQILNTDNAFIVQRISDKAVQYPVATAIMLNHMVENGEIVDIQKFVKDKYNYNNTFYNLSEDEQRILRDKIDGEVKELQDKRSLIAIGQLDSEGKFSIPGIDKNSDTFFALRDKIKGTTKKILGNNSKEDINRIRTTLWGTAFMQFRNWMPEMLEERFDGLQYDAELQTWTYGKLNQFAQDFFSVRIGRLAKAVATGFGHNAVDLAKDAYERAKRNAYEKGDDFDITEGEFIDLYVGNLRSMISELAVLTAFFALILSVGIASGDDDDDKQTKGMKKYLAKLMKKYYQEFSFYYVPTNFTEAVKSPLPVLGLLEDVFKFSSNFIKEGVGRAVGSEKMVKEAKPSKYFFRMVPIAKEALYIWAAWDDEFRKEWDIKIVPGGSY